MTTHQHVIDLPIEVDRRAVLRMMGCGLSPREPRSAAVIEQVDRQLAQSRRLLKARAAYVIRKVDRMTDTELKLGGCPTFHGPIAGFLKPAMRVAVFVVTVGDALERVAQEAMDAGRTLEGFTLDAVGSAAADAATDALAEHLTWHEAGPDESLTPPFSPGYCGMSIDQQAPLFSIVDGRAVGVELLPTMVMRPIKSVSGLLGIGPAEAVMVHGVPCQWCDLDDCKMRRG